MSNERKEPTEAFNKYIDAMFIIDNHLMFVAPRKLDDRLDVRFRYRLETYDDEKSLRAGMCVDLRERIEEELSFEKTHELFKKEMYNSHLILT